MTSADIRLRELDADGIAGQLDELAALLVACVEAGASISFMHPFGQAAARDFWSGVAAVAVRGEAALIAAFVGERLVGCVQLARDLPPNQAHRADVRKLLVHPDARGRGIGRRLMDAVADEARRQGLELLVLDTASEHAERIYAAAGWTRVGLIPNFARLPDGAPGDTAYYYLDLRRPRG
jgi:GNAT superfamily N-acetyltransferase